MIHYARFTVSIHGSSDDNVEATRNRVLGALISEFRPEYASDIDVEIEESA